ncbi:MAG: polyphosphate polymerase domain-containing protein [Acholeplasmataceae bacterium]|nr:polyphosphate polymerase domain-containing protein [Acholeplasmataceae bacterium]
MIKPIFNRYERKYIITTKQKNELISFISEHLISDPYSEDGKAYTIYNIYYDTNDFSIIRNSIQKPTFKDKLRLRTYTYPLLDDDLVFLEIKKKFEGRINKRRVTMTYKVAKDYMESGVKPTFEAYIDNQIMNEIDYFIKIHKAKPGAYIRYDRIAYMSKTDELRITFDHQILFRNQNISFNSNDGNPILSSKDLYLMEVKSEDNFPLWLARKLSEFELYSQSFSKYGKAYQHYLLGGTTDDYILYHY